jgi:CBS domain-containing protein
MLGSVEVKDYMQHNPVKVNATADIFEAIALILEHKISGLCVMDDGDKLVGVLSELDCLRAILSAAYNKQSNVGTVQEYMTRDVVAADANGDILTVASDMLKNKHRRRPVVENGKLVGQITCRQLLRAVKDF